MTLRRYARTPVFGLNQRYGTSFAIPAIRENIENGNIRFEEMILQESERLDTIAGRVYGDARLWWVLAAASNAGWSPQIPPGTLIIIPNLEDVEHVVG
jgi:hypothetical protein